MARSALFRKIDRRMRNIPRVEQLHHLAAALEDLEEVQHDWIDAPEADSAVASVIERLDVHPGTARLLLWAAVSLAALEDQQARVRDALEHGDAPEIRNILAYLAYGIDHQKPRGDGGRLRPFKIPEGFRDRRAPWRKPRKKDKET